MPDKPTFTDEISQMFQCLTMNDLVFKLSGASIQTRTQIMKDIFRSMPAKHQTKLLVELSDSVGHD